jgi:hypothetical protein
MTKQEILERIKDHEFRFQMAGVGGTKPIFKCGICGEMTNFIVQTAYPKDGGYNTISFCSDCYQILTAVEDEKK